MKDLESADQKKNQISDFSIFIFRFMVIFVLKIWSIFDEIPPITRKIKNAKNIYFIFNSIQHIPHLS